MAKPKGNYIFPRRIARAMIRISQRTQYEATLMSLAVILLGLTLMVIVTIFFTDASAFIKIMAGINGLAGFIFLSSFLVTTFQQYKNYLAVMGVIEDETI